MKNLHMYITADVDELASPVKRLEWNWDTPAVEFLKDFSQIRPIVVDTAISTDELKALMLGIRETVLPLEDRQGHFVGVIGLDDISDQVLMRRQAEGYQRQEIQVSDLMTRRQDLPALDWREVVSASISDVVKALQKSGKKECLVIDHRTHRIRGLFSVSDISRKLRQPIEISDSASFYRVFAPVSNRNL